MSFYRTIFGREPTAVYQNVPIYEVERLASGTFVVTKGNVLPGVVTYIRLTPLWFWV